MGDVRWGILGTGSVAGLFAEGLTLVRGARLAAVASRSRQRAEDFAARFGGVRAHEGYDRLVGDPDLDVVYVATHNEHHEEHCLLAIEAGKAVLCEKPFALNAGSASRIVAAARRKGTFCMEGMWMRFAPALREGLAAVRDGRLGQIRLVTAQLGFPHAPESSGRLFSPVGGGALRDLGVYGLSLVQAVMGERRVEQVDSQAIFGPTGVDEQVTALLRFEGGSQAAVTASIRSQLANEATLHGTEAMLRLRPLYFPERIRFTRTPMHRGQRPGRRSALARLRLHPWARALRDLSSAWQERDAMRRAAGTGYGVEAAEVGRCLSAGLRECPEMTLDTTLRVAELMDSVRERWAIRR